MKTAVTILSTPTALRPDDVKHGDILRCTKSGVIYLATRSVWRNGYDSRQEPSTDLHLIILHSGAADFNVGEVTRISMSISFYLVRVKEPVQIVFSP